MEGNSIFYTFPTVSKVHSSLDFGFKDHHFLMIKKLDFLNVNSSPDVQS
jgi:hypothetical protein